MKSIQIQRYIKLLVVLLIVFIVGGIFTLKLMPKGIVFLGSVVGVQIHADNLMVKYSMGILVRIVGVLLLLTTMKHLGTQPFFTYKIDRNCIVLSWLFFIYILANLEIGPMENATPLLVVLMILECFSIGFYEEIIFRGILLGQFMDVFAPSKNGALYAALSCSLAFGLFHLTNLRDGNTVTVLMQVGYTTIMGVVFSALMLRTNWNILWVGLVHGLYDIASGFGDFVALPDRQNTVSAQVQTMDIISELLNLALFLPLLVYGLFLLRCKKAEV